MAIFAHSEEHKVENRLSRLVHWHESAQFRLRLFDRILRVHFRSDAMNISLRNAKRLEKKLPRNRIVAFGIKRGDTSLIGPKKMHVGKVSRTPPSDAGN